MEYRRLGPAGLRVSALSFGAWLTFGRELDRSAARACMRAAFDAGVNFFDNAEVYRDGAAESLMGELLREYRREDLVLSTKVFWGGEGPNDKGLSWKHMVEGVNASLRRLGLEYVDVLFCHRADPDTPVEETVRAIDVLQRQGKFFYWGTSEWPAERIEEAHRAARDSGCAAPVCEQPQYNLLHRRRLEIEYAPLRERHGMGATVWSPLASGLLSGKYQKGIPAGTRLERVDWLAERRTPQVLERVETLVELARELGATPAQLALAWVVDRPGVSTAILGASSVEQLHENLGALALRERIAPEIRARLEAAFPVEAVAETL